MHSIRTALIVMLAVLSPLAAQAQTIISRTTTSSTLSDEDEKSQKQADEALQRQDYSKVIEITNKLLVKHPEMVIALHLRANARIEQGRTARSAQQVRAGIEDARKAVETALKIDKTYVWTFIPYMYGMTTLSELEKRPEHARKALGALAPILKRTDIKDDDRAQLYFQSGYANLLFGDLKTAVADFSETLKFNPRHPTAGAKKSEAQVKLGDLTGALATLDEAAEMLPRSPLVFNERGVLRRKTGDPDGAVEDFSTAIRLTPKFIVAYVNRGDTLMSQNLAEAAEADFDQAILLQPQNAVHRFSRGTARVVQGRFDEAIADYTAASRALTKDPAPLRERGFAKFYKGDFAGAADDLEAAIDRQPDLQNLIPWQGLALLRSGQTAEAQKLLGDYTQRPSAETLYYGTLAAYLLGTIDEEALLNATLDLQGQPVPAMQCEAYLFIGQKKVLAGDMPGANEQYEKAVATNLHLMASHRAARFELGRK